MGGSGWAGPNLGNVHRVEVLREAVERQPECARLLPVLGGAGRGAPLPRPAGPRPAPLAEPDERAPRVAQPQKPRYKNLCE